MMPGLPLFILTPKSEMTTKITSILSYLLVHLSSDNILHMKGSVKEPNKFHIYETEKITRKASDVAKYIELFGSFKQDHHARHI